MDIPPDTRNRNLEFIEEAMLWPKTQFEQCLLEVRVITETEAIECEGKRANEFCRKCF